MLIKDLPPEQYQEHQRQTHYRYYSKPENRKRRNENQSRRYRDDEEVRKKHRVVARISNRRRKPENQGECELCGKVAGLIPCRECGYKFCKECRGETLELEQCDDCDPRSIVSEKTTTLDVLTCQQLYRANRFEPILIELASCENGWFGCRAALEKMKEHFPTVGKDRNALRNQVLHFIGRLEHICAVERVGFEPHEMKNRIGRPLWVFRLTKDTINELKSKSVRQVAESLARKKMT